MPIVRYTSEELRRMKSQTDWARVDAMTDEDIARQAAEDPDVAPIPTSDEDLKRGRRVHRPPFIDVKAIREKTDLSQDRFAETFGFPVGTLRDWEQDRRRPTGPARVLLMLIDRIPDEVASALDAA